MRRHAALGAASLAALFLVLALAPDGYGQNRRRDRDRDDDDIRLLGPLPVLAALPRTAAAPADNPTTPAKVELGRLLFWDPVMSGNRDVACATCHHPRFGYAENRDVSIGVNGIGLGASRAFASPNAIPFVKRNSPTVLNVAFNGINQQSEYSPVTAPMFWDMRVQSLETQALEPLKSFEEMRGDSYPEAEAVATVVARLNAIPEYRTLFSRAFPGTTTATPANLGKALAAFQRSLLANNSPFDRYMRGDRTAMSPAQIEGMRRFEAVGCSQCHNGPMFTDYKAHVLGVDDNFRIAASDQGIPGTPYAFRTASLRNLAFTAPYMHSGVLPDLEEVVEFYDDLPENPNVQRQQVDPLARRLDDPDDEEDALIAFLNALNDDSFDKTIPARVPSGQTVGGKIQ
jgi:cytochrome c peroxidase